MLFLIGAERAIEIGEYEIADSLDFADELVLIDKNGNKYDIYLDDVKKAYEDLPFEVNLPKTRVRFENVTFRKEGSHVCFTSGGCLTEEDVKSILELFE